MPWVKLDDAFSSNPKVLEAGPLGMALQVAALCYCNRHLTDGKLPRPAAAALLSFEGLAMHMWSGEMMGGGEDATWELVAEDLVASGVWHEPGHDCPDCPPITSGFYLHSYLDYQPSKAEVLAERDAKRKAGSKGGKASAQARAEADAQAGAQAESKQDASRGPTDRQAESKPVPVPVPVPKSSSSSRRATTVDPPDDPEEDERISEVWGEIARRKFASAKNVGNRKAWTAEVIRTDKAELLSEARRYVATYPTITVTQLAGVLMGEKGILRVLPHAIGEVAS